MNALSNAQITHESETQRQHARFLLPARIFLNDQKYEAKNLSAGGICFRAPGNFVRGKKIAFDLKLPFGAFALSLRTEAEVQHYNAAEKTVGCSFINAGPEQVSFLNHVIKSFIAGDIVTSGNILNIAARNNFTKTRSPANGNAAAPSFLRQLPGLFAVAIIGLLITTFIVGNLYNMMFIIRSDNAAVTGPTIVVRATSEGAYRSRLDPGLALVEENQVIGTITPMRGGAAVTVQSPCHCYIVEKHLTNGELAVPGQEVISLLPIDAEPWIVAELGPDQAKKIGSNSKAVISIFGSRTKYTGRVVSMESGLSDTRAVGTRPAMMKVHLDQKIPVDFVNRLAAVTLRVY